MSDNLNGTAVPSFSVVEDNCETNPNSIRVNKELSNEMGKNISDVGKYMNTYENTDVQVTSSDQCNVLDPFAVDISPSATKHAHKL